MNEHLRLTVVRRVGIRDELRPIKAWWHFGRANPDWLVITHETGPKGYETFTLQFLKFVAPACATPGCQSSRRNVVIVSWMSYETLRIAKDQAHADVGIEYLEWEPCQVEITDEKGIVHWETAIPSAELGSTMSGEPSDSLRSRAKSLE